ncbi:FkbM family methyltransferase [Staphylothermus hellenicus]|uniref:Methyltransferase FkbM family n=1 Tax=Staphylothermus hellenicus (strain DSM 12710 / JCM 10830 / BK20S6-10-b1 / P8) TaxID=591019 RepID=D7D8A0_STAHD|nr:FkbM family methyltransferase [Staphylothermus hellenicus]ADI31996.1 methyltransferase FkbM family [Staphylothermus hellenicus DSM 12710]
MISLKRLKRRTILCLKGKRAIDKFRIVMFSMFWSLISVMPSAFKPILHRLADLAIRGVIIQYRGSYYSLSEASSVYLFYSEYEPWTWKYLQSLKQDHVFIDVGAHIGLYTIYVANILRGRVIAIEPNPESYEFLLRNIQLNNLKRVIALNIVAWKEDGRLRLCYTPGDTTRSSVKRIKGQERCVSVRARKLDSLLRELNIDRIDLVKIDVEGAEREVLQGMEKILEHYKPRLIVEIWRENLKNVLKYLRKLNYSFTVIPESISSDSLYIYAYPA